jgi:hypothetical protein
MFIHSGICFVLHENADLLENSLGQEKDLIASLLCIRQGHNYVFSSSVPICEL